MKRKLTTRQKESKKINRKRAVRQWWRITSRRFLLLCLIFTVTFCSIGGCWLWRTDKVAQLSASVSDKFWKNTACLGFKVKNVYLEGRVSTPLAEITKAMNIKSGDPILGISLPQLRNSLQEIPRIKYAEVSRILPDQLHVHIVEREPVAIWQNGRKLHLIDDEGVAMEYIDPAQYKTLLLVVGEDAPAHTRELFNMLALEPELYKNVAAVLRIGERRWNIRFKNGIELKLPEKESAAAWQNFANMEHENHILEKAIRSVDMRLSDRIFIKYAPSEMPQQKNNYGRET